MCDICRVFKLCHQCNRNTLDGPGYKLTINKHDKRESWETIPNVLNDIKDYLSSNYRKSNVIFEAGFCTECSKQIAVKIFYGYNKYKIYLNVDIDLMQVTFERILQFPILKTQKTPHCVFGSHETTIRSSWFEDDTGQIWYCRSSWGGGRFQKIKKTKKQVMRGVKC